MTTERAPPPGRAQGASPGRWWLVREAVYYLRAFGSIAHHVIVYEGCWKAFSRQNLPFEY
jgi:hypothetical protein